MDLYELAHSLHEDHLREAEKVRRYGQHLLDAPPATPNVLLRLGNHLSAFVSALYAQRNYMTDWLFAHAYLHSPCRPVSTRD